MRRPVVPNLTHEHILIFFKGDWIPREKTANMDARYKQWVVKGVWRIQTESAKGMNHIAPYPLKLAERCVALWSLEGDTVLDPFMGSGTTAVACKQLQRNFIGFELSQKYVDIANKRLQQDTLFSYDVLQTECE
jgi:site-specific DNA-methyltransferase (adenine-specific)